MANPPASSSPHRVHNFNAGPATLPLPALELARDELLDFEGTGMSILEHSHRGKDYDRVHVEAIALIRELLAVPDTHDVLFLQGGASQQFAMVPMNLLHADKSADYVVTGGWAEKALAEAKIVGKTKVAATTEVKSASGEKVYRRVPKESELQLDPAAAYVHITTNNTLFGTQWMDFPTTKAPLVADMSSDFLWRPFDVSKFHFVYAGAQKNIGPSGIVVVLARKDFIASGRTDIPKIFRYATHAKENSLYNTPPTFSIYLARNVLRWVKANGGAKGMQERNEKKAATLYGAIDAMPFYRCPVEKESRSRMNVVFNLPKPELEEKFVAEAKKKEMVGLKGHRSVGGIRVSTYNAVSQADVEALVAFMQDFAKANG
jgi:phosphoserine aminotransferase